jgi:hypothetical protein
MSVGSENAPRPARIPAITIEISPGTISPTRNAVSEKAIAPTST